ncbi:Protein kinase superfamily protein [Striga hermonthica]|uniref:Protein kinase superfamily protein n=1 Tax=Striga hermonthica TaxID=68872 RepID=A0A9N7NBM9_STRHE|nr:Protein kinase superfamily protein [Striga hermonthica]
MASAISPVPVICSARATQATKRSPLKRDRKSVGLGKKQRRSRNGGGLGNVVEVVQKDVAFLKAGFSKGLRWANRAFRVPEVSKSVEDLIWLRNVEDPQAVSSRFPSWPEPYYPELSGVDLFLADLKAMEVYASYFYHLSKMWTKPLPEMYDAEEVTEYFTLRPHVVGLRLLEVFIAFVSATIKFRISSISSAADADAGGNDSDYNFGMVLKETMLNLGPTFIKVGQSLSTRPDITGYGISKALSELHDQIPPFPRAKAMKIIEEELGSPVETFFSYVSEEPVAAASFGQVYKASTRDGLDVAVKVQRPDLRHVVVRDIYILRIGLGILQKVAKRKNDLRLYADELGKGLVGELDYNLEAANALEFMEVHSRFKFICSPKVFRHLTNKRVLTMDWMVGESPSELISMSSQESRRKLLDLVNKGVEASLVQLLETGLMHADPHPGNLRYIPGKIGFLDFGLLCRMEKKHQLGMLASIVHIVNCNWANLVQDLVEMDVVRSGTNIRRFTMDLEDALGELEFNDGMPDVKFSLVLSRIWSVALKYHCRMPPYYVLVLRSLASLEGLAVASDPSFKTFEAAYPYVIQKLLVDNSAATRKILHSVVFNNRREFQWKRLAVFLRIGATRKQLQSLVPVNTQTSLTQSSDEISRTVDLANLALKILPSKNGIVLRRLLMTADGASLVRALVSNEASPFRQQICKIAADVLYLWMCKAIQKGLSLARISSPVLVQGGACRQQIKSNGNEYETVLRDRRLRVIFFKHFNSARKDPLLVLRFLWTSLVILFTASAVACHRVLASLTGDYLNRLSYNSNRIATAA